MLQINSRSPTFRKQVIAILVSGVFAQLAFANNPEYEAPPLDEIVVSASGYEQKIMDTAASINLVTINQIQNGQARDNLSEPLNRVPGIFALNRQNYAQDLQISSRGFGANSTFGTRGIRLIVDNIPGTVADGQGQISHIDLPSTDRIEVMRGPFSVLYGNSSGGVIRVFTQDGGPKTEVQPYFEVGSYGQRRAGLKASGKSGELGYVIDAGQFHTNGYRDQSAADRRNANAKLSFMGGLDTRITLIANNVSLKAQDPTGLTESQLIANPKQAGTSAVSQNSRKSVDQTQVGASIDFRINANNNFLFSPYLGQRHVLQYLTSATAGSGVIDYRVDEEDPAPADRIDEDTAQQWPDGETHRAHRGVDSEGGALLALGSDPGDERLDAGNEHRCSEPLNGAAGNDQLLVLRQTAQERAEREDHQAEVQPLDLPYTVTEHPAGDQQHGERDQVGVHHPLAGRRTQVEILLDGGQGDTDDREVDCGDQAGHRQHEDRDLPAACRETCALSLAPFRAGLRRSHWRSASPRTRPPSLRPLSRSCGPARSRAWRT